ncbi:MAG: hypothetical protein E7Z92_01130 [Cyanobacteria bacterium SIG31]|nr:hypothetical protein [Cyanobacteria bacterium SIG31]
MVHKKTRKFDLSAKLTTSLLLSMFLSCPIFAENSINEAYFDYIAQLNNQKLYNPIHLDTSKTIEVLPKTSTSIPFNLREFSEADYFSSEIEDLSTLKQSIPPSETLQEETVASSDMETISNDEEKGVLSINEDSSIPYSATADFFSPTAENTQNSSIKNEIKKDVTSKFIENTVFANDYESKESQYSDYEGKMVSKVNFVGLTNLNEDYILSQINTQKGTLYNPNLLQLDLQKIYSTGYFSDEMFVEPELNSDGTVSLTFILEENIVVKNVEIIGNTIFTQAELNNCVSNLKGKPQNLLEINKSIERIQSLYHDKSYILANVASVEETPDGILTLTISEGIINKIGIIGNERTKDYVIERNIITQAGSVYNEEVLKKDLAKVFSTQIFDEVDRDIQPSTEKEGTYDISVIVKEKSTNSIAFGGGIDTGLGAFGSISLREDNFLGKGQKVALSGILGSGILLSDASIKNHMNYQAELSFFEPYFLNADNSLMSKIYFREMGSWTVPLAIERRIGASVGVEHKIKGNDKLATSFTAGIEHIDLKEGDYNKISELYKINNLNIADRARQLDGGFFFNLSPGIRYSSLDSVENPREGIVAQARFTEALGVTDFNRTNGRLSGAITKFFPVFKKSSFSLTAKGGIKVHGDEMPEVMAFRLGGPYTIRGYRMNGVGTGESFLMGSAELATPLPFVDKLKWDFVKKMRLTFFVDAGKVFNPTVTNVLFDRPEHAITAGIGLRVYIPDVGPISVDYGLPITNPGRNGSEHGYFTFGSGGMNVYGYGY